MRSMVWSRKRRSASEKLKLSEEDLENISLAAWLKAIEQTAGKPVQVVKK